MGGRAGLGAAHLLPWLCLLQEQTQSRGGPFLLVPALASLPAPTVFAVSAGRLGLSLPMGLLSPSLLPPSLRGE